MVFIDSMQIMNSGLDALSKDLSDNDFKHLSQESTGEKLKLVKQKGVHPYEYMKKHFKTFSEDKLPDICRFYSSLKDECISKKDFLRAINVWNTLLYQSWIKLECNA